MNEDTFDLFLDPPKIGLFESVKSATLAFYECKWMQLDPVIPAQLALRDAHKIQTSEFTESYQRACTACITETFRVIIGETCKNGASIEAAYWAYVEWTGQLIRGVLAYRKKENAAFRHAFTKGAKLPDPDADRRVMLEGVLTQPPPKNPVQKFTAEFCRRLRDYLGPDNLLWLYDGLFMFRIVMQDDFARWLAQPALDLESLEEECHLLREKASDRAIASMRIECKIATALSRVMAPILEHLRRVVRERTPDFLTWMLCRMILRFGARYQPWKVRPEDLTDRPDYDFWGAQFVFQALFQAEQYDWKTFASGVITIVESPRSFVRWHCAPEHQSIKNVLRGFVEIIAGPVQYPVERAHLLTRMHAPDVDREEIITLTSEYFALLCDTKTPSTRLRNQLDPLVYSWIDDLPAWFSRLKLTKRKFRLRQADDVEFEKLLAEEAAMAEEMAHWQASWSNYRSEPDDETDTELPPIVSPENISITYVENLGSEAWRTHTIQCPRQDFASSLQFYLGDRGIETVVPVSSITRAIEHFLFEMDSEQRTLVPMERIAGEPWRKLKRGAQRIYILKKNGDVFVHLMKRKDWIMAAEQEARF